MASSSACREGFLSPFVRLLTLVMNLMMTPSVITDGENVANGYLAGVGSLLSHYQRRQMILVDEFNKGRR